MTFHRYFPHTEEDISKMLERCNASSIEDLFADIPEELRLKHPYAIPSAEMSELEINSYFRSIAAKNRQLVCFAGAGFYDHYTPAAIDSILARSEFQTAYTPYQPEISQGTLQYIFEFQSMMTELTGLDVCNASMYDGTTATAEAMMMAVSAAKRKNRVLVAETLSPAIHEVLATYALGHNICIDIIPEKDGVSDREYFERKIASGDVAAVIVASPNFYGILEKYDGWSELCHTNKALFIINSHAATLATIKTPGEWGADIACGEAQSLGIPLNYGGPYLGYLCATKALMRKMPGRIVGATTDASGQRVFVLTLQAREQHIRRQKATSNICSNQGIMTLHAAAYMSLLGAEGLQEVNRISFEATHSLAEALCATGKLKLRYPDKTYLNEVALDVISPLNVDMILKAAVKEGILAGVKLSDSTILVAATEMCSPDDIKRYVSLVNTL